MDRLKEAIGVGLILGAFHGAAQAVPVVPNFTQGSLTSRTETTSKVVETINTMQIYRKDFHSTASGPRARDPSPRKDEVSVPNQAQVPIASGSNILCSRNLAVTHALIEKVIGTCP